MRGACSVVSSSRWWAWAPWAWGWPPGAAVTGTHRPVRRTAACSPTPPRASPSPSSPCPTPRTSPSLTPRSSTRRRAGSWTTPPPSGSCSSLTWATSSITGRTWSSGKTPASSMGLLEQARIPYGVCLGNHDLQYSNASGQYPATIDGSCTTFKDLDCSASHFLDNFGPKRFAGQAWFGGGSPSGLSSYQRINVEGIAAALFAPLPRPAQGRAELGPAGAGQAPRRPGPRHDPPLHVRLPPGQGAALSPLHHAGRALHRGPLRPRRQALLQRRRHRRRLLHHLRGQEPEHLHGAVRPLRRRVPHHVKKQRGPAGARATGGLSDLLAPAAATAGCGCCASTWTGARCGCAPTRPR